MILFFKKYCIYVLAIALIFISKDGVCSEEKVSAKDSEMIEIISGGLLNTSVYPDIYRNESEGETFSNNITVQDPYRYLDNDSYIANKTEFISKLNNISLTYFTNVSSYNDIKNKVEKYMHYERYDVLGKHGNYYYYLYNNGSQETDILIQTDNYTNIRNATKFVDLNNKTQSGEYLLTKAAFSSDGNIIAYAVSENGSDSNTIYFKYQNGTELNDTIKGVIYSEITFVFNGTGFIYSKYNATDNSEDNEDEDEGFHTMYFHKMGNNQTDDVPIANSNEDLVDGSVSPDGKYLFATFWIGGSDENYITYYDISNYTADNFTGTLNSTSLFNKTNAANHEIIYSNDTHALVKTDKNAPYGKVIEVSFSDQNNKTLIDERNNSKLQGAWAVGNQFLILNYLENVTSRLYVYSRLNGSLIQKLDILNLNGTVKQHSASVESNETFFEFENELTPKTIFRVNLTNVTPNTSLNVEEVARPKIEGFNSSEFVVKQVFYPSADPDVNISMFILSRKDVVLNKSNPVLLEVYGAFGVPVAPHFSAPKMMFVKHFNGVSCYANVRGGGEFGEKWHEDGMLLNKHNTFNDTALAAHYLIENNYTRPTKIALLGGAHGGLAAAVVAQQRPELLQTVVLRSPPLDMIYYKNYSIGKYWVGEYGDPDFNKTVFEYLYKYSPLHNIRLNTTAKQEWPNTIITASVDDHSISVTHTLKYMAQLYHTVKTNASDFQYKPLLAYIENGTSTGDIKQISKAKKEITHLFSFLSNALNMTFHNDTANETKE